MTTVPTANPLPSVPFRSPNLLEVPPLLRDLQAEQPISRVRTPAGDEAWLVTRHADVKALFLDPRLGRSHPDPEHAARISRSPLMGGAAGNFATEKEDHERMRRLLTPAFSPTRIKALRPRIDQLVDELLTAMAAETPPVDLHARLSFPLPVMVISELLGIPTADRDQFRQWSNAAAMTNDPDSARRALRDLGLYLYPIMQHKRTAPAEDVLSDLAAAQASGELTVQQAVAFAVILLFAGHETTVTRIDYGTLLLLANPDQRDRLIDEPDLIDTAVEEILRSGAGNGGGLPRYAREDIQMDGITMRAGDAILLAIGAANHDPAAFQEPDSFDVGREPNAHLAFGYGIRYCIGASLARTELNAVFSALPLRFPTLRLAVPQSELRRRWNVLTGGLESLPVTW